MTYRNNVIPDNYTGGVINWRLWLVDKAAKIAGLLVKVEGFPIGTNRNIDFNHDKGDING